MYGGRGSTAGTFERARRRHAYRRLARVLAGGSPSGLLRLDEATRRLRPFSRHYAGLRAIPLHQVVGTDSRPGDFDRDFLPLRPGIGERWRRVEEAFPDGNFPPIVVYQLGDVYFVVDGHHRAAIARQRGMQMIDAEVTELKARWHLRADADVVELIHAEQQWIFLEESGLAVARPEACICIDFSRLTGYIELLEIIQVHGYHLMLEEQRVLAPAEIAADWYDRVYLPALESFRREGLVPQGTEADLFLCVHQRRRELLPHSNGIALEDAARHVLEDDGKRASSARMRRLLGRAA